jgi:methionyl-tRNA formyltransferase
MTHKPFVYFGTPYVARETLASLLEAGYVPSLVVTSPDAPKGRGMKLTPSDTKAFALEKNLSVISPEKLDAPAIDAIRRVGAHFGIVVAYGKILPQALIDAFPLGLLNVHYSLLPKYRGASPVEAALLHDDAVTGVAIQKLVKELDAGDILAAEELAILPEETTRELRPRLITLGASLLTRSLPAFTGGSATFTPQDHAKATKTGKIKKEEGLLDLAGDARVAWNKYRAYAESPGTYFYAGKDGERVRVKIKTAKYENGAFIPLRVIPEGKNEMDYARFLEA